jgi:hypothetical protein
MARLNDAIDYQGLGLGGRGAGHAQCNLPDRDYVDCFQL